MDQFTFEKRGLLMVLSAPSGGGKSVVLRRLLEGEAGLTYSVSVTSRPPRPGEVDGQDYHFVDRPSFEEMIRKDVFYEWAEVHGNLYGTREDTVDEALGRGLDVAMDLDVKGGLSVKWRRPDSVLVFLMPPSIEVLEQRLRERKTDSEEQIQLRLKNAQEELTHWRLYDYVVVNDSLDQTLTTVGDILHAERCRARRLRLRGDS